MLALLAVGAVIMRGRARLVGVRSERHLVVEDTILSPNDGINIPLLRAGLNADRSNISQHNLPYPTAVPYIPSQGFVDALHNIHKKSV